VKQRLAAVTEPLELLELLELLEHRVVPESTVFVRVQVGSP
jgi:hypothetical protein